MHAPLWATSLFAGLFAGQPAPGGIGMDWMLIFGVGFLLMWFIVLRPAQRKERERKESLTKVKKGDRVVVAGGIVGTVQSTEENVPGLPPNDVAITVRVDDKTRLTVLRSS